MRAVLLIVLPVLCGLAACKETKEAPTPSPDAIAAPAPSPSAAAGTFDPGSVPESTANLPPFPLFKPLDGLVNILDDTAANVSFDKDYFVAGTALVPQEGKVFRAAYNLAADRPYSAIEFQRNHEQAISQLGGVSIGGPLNTDPYRNELAAQATPPASVCMTNACDAQFYLIRHGGMQYWISVGTGSVPLHGYITVLERQDMAKSYAFMDASALKRELDARGRVPVYIEFDLDKSALRADAMPAVDEIFRLLESNGDLKLSIEGHTDDTGEPAHNRELSLARAKSVQSVLLSRGIAASRLKVAGFGADKPLATGTSAQDRARNRRVELVRIQ